MSNMSEDIQYAGSDTRPPMLDRTDFESWQQRIRLYCLGKDNGENIMKSITEGIPKDIYTLINHYTDAKDIWDNVKMILEGSELTKDDRESQLYDEFERFCQIKGETIHVYYVRFSKLINDMRNIKMTMSRMQLNSKFVNNMLPEWSRFITEVKLNRGLKESNFDQLYAFLEANRVQTALFKEVKVMEEIFDQMSGEVDQNTVDKQCAEIVKKNFLIENENLIANCLSNQLLYNVENTLLDLELRYIFLVNTNEDLKAQLEGNLKVATRSSVKTKVLAPGMYLRIARICDWPCPKVSIKEIYGSHIPLPICNYEKARVNTSTEASGSKPRSNTKNNRILPAKSVNNKKVEDHPRSNKSDLDKSGTDIPLVYDSGCSKHMTGNRSKLKNFMEKFIGIYNKRTRRIMETIHVTFDEMHQTMAPVRISSGPEPIMMTPGQLNSGLAPLPILATTYIPPIDKDLEILFQPIYAPIVSTNTSVSTTITQDAPSTSHLLSFSQVHPPVFPQGVAVGPTIKDTSITQADLHPLVNPVVGEPSSAQLNSGDSNQDFKMAVIETAGSSHAKMKFTNLINLKYGKFSTVAQIYVIVARIEAIEYSVPMLKPSKFDIYQLDVKTAFRMVFFKEEVFVSVSQKD
ncbi:hypothetical protein Tco_1293817 [Tanacetum coccineum]